MISSRSWKAYQPAYRAEQMKTLASWILAGQSGSVVGLAGAGKSNLLGFLCHRPEVLRSYLPPEAGPVALIPVDLNNLPSNTLATFYRVILRSFYEVRDRFDQTLQQTTTDLYLENRATRDSFLAQRALRELREVYHNPTHWLLKRAVLACSTAISWGTAVGCSSARRRSSSDGSIVPSSFAAVCM